MSTAIKSNTTTATAIASDARLLTLATEVLSAHERWVQALANDILPRLSRWVPENARQTEGALREQWSAKAKEMAEIPARGVAGLRAKASVALCIGFPAWATDEDHVMLLSIAHDLAD